MNASQNETFEQLLKVAEGLLIPQGESERVISWCDSSRQVGLSRQSNGSIELFLVDGEYLATSLIVRRHLRFNEWERIGGSSFRANRLVFPPEDHFVPVIAFVAEELLRVRRAKPLRESFHQIEPLLELLIGRQSLTEEELIGLMGELRFLEALLSVADSEVDRERIIDAWKGHDRAARDFSFSGVSIEVKTTRSIASHHKISHVSQVDPRRTDAGDPIENLYLISCGLSRSSANDCHANISLPEQTERILRLLSACADSSSRSFLQLQFLEKLSSYGGEPLRGYLHDDMRDLPPYQHRWRQTFVRVYDMCDPAMSVVRASDIDHCAYVPLDSVEFRLELPDRVVGDINPRTDLYEFAKECLV